MQNLTESPQNPDFSLMTDIIKDSLDIGKGIHLLCRKSIPSSLSVTDIDNELWKQWIPKLEEQYEWYPENRIIWNNAMFDDIKTMYCIHLQKGVTLVYYEHHNKIVIYYDYATPQAFVSELKSKSEQLVSNDIKTKIGYLHYDFGRLHINFQQFKVYEKDLTAFLGESVLDFKKEVISSMADENESGLFLLYGEAGTGKTSFIKTILGEVEQQAIYLTPGYAESLTSPQILSILMDYPNSIIVIEDAESVLMKRQADNSNAISNLLNLTDGFPADFLKLKIICTFNTKLENLDPALLRAGRLQGMMEFKRLTPDSANKLAANLGKDTQFDEPATLAQICNPEFETPKARKTVGF